MLEGRPVVAVPHDPLSDLWGHALAGQDGAQRRPHRVQIDDPALVILRDDPRLGAWGAFPDHDRLTVLVGDDLLPGEAGAEEVEQSRSVGDGRREDLRLRLRHRHRLIPSALQLLCELRVKWDLIGSLRLADADRDLPGLEVHVRPGQPLQIAFPQAGQGGRQIPRPPAARLGHVQQPGEFVIGERPTHAPAVLPLVQLGNGLERIRLQPASADAPGAERHGVRPARVDRPGRSAGVGQGVQVALDGIRGQVGESGRLDGLAKPGQVLLFLIDVPLRLPGPAAVRDVGGQVIRERLPALDRKTIEPRVHHAVTAQSGVPDTLGEDTFRRCFVRRFG
ncbi:MAG: hypothetical protein SYC29_04410 [Planctomycetota bacterium]|nr:hypothetical protein [Planctomycetota bacterium]